ncbi:MAG TPA: MFS transporter, partial [Ktedonobacterales bacterium]|nr:MFS transporter [Ktedonobacterales bacterium]
MHNLSHPASDVGAIHANPPASPKPAVREPWILVATILGSSMVFIDGTVVNVALPTLQRTLGATAVDVQWVVEAYAIFLAALILVGGALGDRFGRRRLFAIGIAVFTIASMWCGLAPNIGQLIAARAVQGIGGALLTPGSLAIISATIGPATRGRAIGTWSGFTTVTSALGPVLGGWIIQSFSWRWIFFINVPLAAATLAIAFWHVPETRADDSTGTRLDWRGAAAATIGLGLLVYGLISAETSGFADARVLIALAGGLVALIAFLLIEARVRTPMMPLSLFSSRAFSGTNLLTFLLYGALGGALYFVPFDLQQVHGYSPAEAGAVFLPFTIIVFSLSRWAGGLVTRYGSKLPLVVGPSIAAVGFLLYAVPGTSGSYWTTFFPAIVVLSLGMAITIAPLTTTVMGAVDQQHAGVASGVNNAVSRAAGLVAIAILGIVIVGVFDGALTGHLTSLQVSPSLHHAIESQKDRLAAINLPSSISQATHAQVTQAINDSFLTGFRVVMFCAAALALASAVIAGFMIPGKAPASVP